MKQCGCTPFLKPLGPQSTVGKRNEKNGSGLQGGTFTTQEAAMNAGRQELSLRNLQRKSNN